MAFPLKFDVTQDVNMHVIRHQFSRGIYEKKKEARVSPRDFLNFPRKKKRSRLPEISRQLCRFQVSLTGKFAKKVFVLKKLLVRASEYCFVINSHFKPAAASLIRKFGSIISIHFYIARAISLALTEFRK